MERKIIKKQGFTLIELLVAVFIFAILFLIIMAFVNLAVSQPKSSHTKSLTTSLRHTLDTINQKLDNANVRVNTMTPNIYGFRVYSDGSGNKILEIANYSKTVSGANVTTCTFIAERLDTITSTYRIFMGFYNNCPNTANLPSAANLDKPLTDTNVALNSPTDANPGLSFSGTTSWDAKNNCTLISPYLKITINAKDNDPKYANDNQINLQTSFTMSYQTILSFKNQYRTSEPAPGSCTSPFS